MIVQCEHSVIEKAKAGDYYKEALETFIRNLASSISAQTYEDADAILGLYNSVETLERYYKNLGGEIL